MYYARSSVVYRKNEEFSYICDPSLNENVQVTSPDGWENVSGRESTIRLSKQNRNFPPVVSRIIMYIPGSLSIPFFACFLVSFTYLRTGYPVAPEEMDFYFFLSPYKNANCFFF